MTDTTQPRPDTAAHSVAEIVALTARLRTLADAGAAADPTERARVRADKHALIERITAASSRGAPPPSLRGRAKLRAAAAADDALTEVCLLYTSDAADDLTRVDLGGRAVHQRGCLLYTSPSPRDS